MSEHIRKWIECDVCTKAYYNKDSITKVWFRRDGKEFAFDCCYDCLRGKSVRNVYKAMLRFMRIKKSLSGRKV